MKPLLVAVAVAVATGAAPIPQVQLAAAQKPATVRAIGIEEGIDTGAAIRLLQTIPYSSSTPAAWVFTVYYSGQSGRVDSVTHFRPGTLPARTADSIRAILRMSARQIPTTGATGVMWVLAVAGEYPILRAPNEQQPRITNRRQVSRSLTRFTRTFLQEHPHWRGHAAVTVTVQMKVDSAGVPQEPRVTALSPFVGLNAEALKRAEEMRFEPARIEGEPVTVWVAIPIAFTFH